MIFPLAWPRAILVFILSQAALFSSIVEAKIDSLFTSSVTYCSPPEAVLIQEFSIIYYASNQSVSYNISAASVVPNLRVRANIMLNVYGMQPVNVTEDFCQAFGEVLCPLPTYNFTGSSSLSLPSFIDVASKVPNVAYKIPDLEAFAQLTLTDINTGSVAACIQATLSNGWTSRQPAVSFGTGGVAIFALFSALAHLLLPSTPLSPASAYTIPSLAPAKFVEFILLIQQISFTGLLHLNFPLVYRAFTLNFGWALGLFPGSRSIQNAIDRMRHLTGGRMHDGVESPTVFVSRQLSPYNVPVPPGASTTAFYLQRTNTKFLAMNGSIAHRDFTTDSSAGDGPPATVTNSAENFLPAGIPVYVNSLNIGTANGFMSVFFTILIGVVVGAGLLGILYGLLTFMTTRMKSNKWAWADVMHAESRWFAISAGTIFTLVIMYPVFIFTFFQWTLKDSWLSVLLSVLLIIYTMTALFYPVTRIMIIARRATAQKLFTTPSYLRTVGVIYIPFRQDSSYFSFLFLSAALIKSIFISFVRTNGIAQVTAILTVELTLLVLLCVKRPYCKRSGNILGIYLGVTRVAAAAMMFPFVTGLRIKAIPRVAVGFVIMVIFSIAIIVMVFNIIWNFGAGLFWHRHDGRPLPSSDGSLNDLEKGSPGLNPTLQSITLFRPTNPTPSTSFSKDTSTHNRHTPRMSAAVSPNYTIPSIYTSDLEDEASSPRLSSQTRSQRSSFLTASSPPSSAQHEAFPSPSSHSPTPHPMPQDIHE